MSNALEKPWSYDDAVAELKPKIVNWQKRTLEIVRLLAKANKELSRPGYRSDRDDSSQVSLPTSTQLSRGCEENITQESPKTWQQFCEDVGIPKATANRWLALYDAEEDRLLTSEEFKARALAIRDELFETVRSHRYSGEPEWTPEKWSPKLETQYRTWLIEKGYDRIEIKPDYYGQALEDDGMEGLYEFGMFSRSYIFDIGVRATRRMSGDGAIRADNAIQRYKARIPAGIETRDMMRIPELGLAALELFPEEKRRQVAILAAEIFRDLALEENG